VIPFLIDLIKQTIAEKYLAGLSMRLRYPHVNKRLRCIERRCFYVTINEDLSLDEELDGGKKTCSSINRRNRSSREYMIKIVKSHCLVSRVNMAS